VLVVVVVAGVEAGGEADRELVEVVLHGPLRLGGGRVHGAEVDGGRPHQQVGRGQGLGQPLALPGGQGRHQPPGELLGTVVEPVPEPQPLAGQPHGPPAAVGGVGGDRDQAVVLEPAQLPGQLPRVQPEAGAQVAHGAPGRTDLEDQAGRAERQPQPQERLVERTDPLGVGAVEPAQHLGVGHSLTLVRERLGR
jgi:hypothetical protein